jgi:glyoxylase-like metal-dependent hydrolase (beta-lactamase superfamily II)
LGSGATAHAVAISKFDANFVRFDGAKIEIFKHIRGDTDENTMLWIPGQRILIAGDVVFNDMHVYTAETDGKAREKWLNSLAKIRELNPSVVIPGHSKKPTALLINASRGPIVDEQALIGVLKNRQIAGAAVDVFDIEPLPPSHPFRTLHNVLATPHIGYVSRGLYQTFYEDIVSSIRMWLDSR